ncbi:MAG: multicopper oxidase domain-containing protein [Planctomycetaceae bacterium]
MIARPISFRFGKSLCAALAVLFANCLVAIGADGPEGVHNLPAPPKVLPKAAPRGKYGVIDENLFTVFGTYVIPGRFNDDGSPKQIWTRSYQNIAPVDPTQLRNAHLQGANQPPKAHIPGPTFVFKPDDFLRIRLHNFLNRSDNPWLNELQNNLVPGGGVTADELPESAAHEVNIPHGFNETNLHVHGLHVDPKQDNVTVLILPQDGDPSALSPDQQGLVQNINQWWQRRYQYKIPTDHLPGTHWYHSHRHGSTSIQVENGMAGALVIQSKHDKDDIVPGLAGTDHDRVMVVQEIQNFAINVGDGKGKKQPELTPVKDVVITVNGKYSPTLKIPQAQVERWRFVIAGANHQQQSNIWVGRIDFSPMSPELINVLKTINKSNYLDYIGKTPKSTFPNSVTCDFSKPANSTINGSVNLVAIDGVTLSRAVPITAQTPTFGSSGNRSDLLVQADPPPAGSAYFVFKNYPKTAPPIQGFAAAYPADKLFDESDENAQWRYLALSKGKTATGPAVVVSPPKTGIPANVQGDPYNLGANFAGFTVPWASNVQSDGSNPGDPSNPKQALTPIITGVAPADKKSPITAAYSQPAPTNPVNPKDPNGITGGRWQPAGGPGGGVTQDYLMYVQVVPPVAGPKFDLKSLNAVLNTISPTGNPATTRLTRTNEQGQTKPGIPSYVAPFGSTVDFQRTVTFDHSSTTFVYEDKTTGGSTPIQQFWIDGRQFSSADYVGNPAATSLIQRPIINEMQSMGSFASANLLWTNQTQPLAALGQIAVSDPTRPNLKPTRPEILNTNAGYYRPVTLVTPTAAGLTPYYTYNYGTGALPDYKSVTGFSHSQPPMAGTSEEWMLVNNSDIYHPFHIHISPFFVEEVGQLHSDGKTFTTRKIIWDSKSNSVVWEPADLPAANRTFGWVVGNWWDTILIPPHGYVRFKTWINIPDQKPTQRHAPKSPTDDVEPDDWKVTDNANVFGSWVFHCHILRHEDRGMMSMVAVTPRPHSLAGMWSDGKQPLKVFDAHGTVRVYTGAPNFPGPYAYKGRFSEGLGNPFQSSPWTGSMNFKPFDATSTSIPFCAAYSGSQKTPFQIVFANGAGWLKEGSPATPAQPAATKLTGKWTDPDGNVASITQLANAPDGKSAPIEIAPVTPVWWAAGTGSWNIGQGATGFQGTLVYNNNQTTTQQLSFCVSADQNTIIFSNGIRWIRTP